MVHIAYSLFYNLGTTYQIRPEHETIAVANGYRVEKDPSTGQYFALKGNETSKNININNNNKSI
jgi:hypothetical protein